MLQKRCHRHQKGYQNLYKMLPKAPSSDSYDRSTMTLTLTQTKKRCLPPAAAWGEPAFEAWDVDPGRQLYIYIYRLESSRALRAHLILYLGTNVALMVYLWSKAASEMETRAFEVGASSSGRMAARTNGRTTVLFDCQSGGRNRRPLRHGSGPSS